jgi:hypothetical protein
MSPMPLMPPPGIAGAAFFSGLSATIASVVISSDATEAAPCILNAIERLQAANPADGEKVH